MTWRGITYEVRNKQVQANLQQVAEQQDSSMQTDQAVAGQHDGLIAALNTTKASLAAVLKAAPGRASSQALQAVVHYTSALDDLLCGVTSASSDHQ